MAERKDELTTSERIFLRIALLQTVLAVAGIVTGAIALHAGLTAADAARKQQEASVSPMLQMPISDYDVETRQPILRVAARNAGIGPARIAAFRVTVDGVARANWDDIFTALAGSLPGVVD